MAGFLLQEDGIFVGSSSAMNCVGAVKMAQVLGPGHTIVTCLCDQGHRSMSKLYNPAYLAEREQRMQQEEREECKRLAWGDKAHVL